MSIRARAGYVLLSVLALAGVALVCLEHRSQIAATLAQLSPAAFAVATMLHLCTLACRAECWGVTLAAIERRAVGRRAVHAASAAGFAAGTVETHLALPARVAALRRASPDTAPLWTQMLLSDVPLMALEAFCAAALLLVAAGALHSLPWWSALVALAAAASGVVVLRLVRGRLRAHALADGLAVLEARERRGKLAGLTVTIVGLTLARISVLLAACGVAHDPAHVALTYIAVAVLGLLPIGPASNPAAMIAAAGAASVGAKTAAGLALAASTVAAVAVYGLGVVLLLTGISVRRRPRHRRRAFR